MILKLARNRYYLLPIGVLFSSKFTSIASSRRVVVKSRTPLLIDKSAYGPADCRQPFGWWPASNRCKITTILY